MVSGYGPARAAGPIPMLFLQQLRGELRKLYARPRTWMGYGAFLLMEGLILWAYRRPGWQAHLRETLERNNLDFSALYSSLTVTFTIMAASMMLVLDQVPDSNPAKKIAAAIVKRSSVDGRSAVTSRMRPSATRAATSATS